MKALVLAFAAILMVSSFAHAQSGVRQITGDEAMSLFLQLDQSQDTIREPAVDVVVLRSADGRVECLMDNAHGAQSANASVICTIPN